MNTSAQLAVWMTTQIGRRGGERRREDKLREEKTREVKTIEKRGEGNGKWECMEELQRQAEERELN